MPDAFLPRVLFVFGVGFLAANLRLALQFARFYRLRPTALLIWPRQRPPFYGLMLLLGALLGVLILFKLVVQQRHVADVFGEAMMLVYYGYLMPLSMRIGYGFYRDGVWCDAGFVPYTTIGGMRWREERDPTLVLLPRMRQIALTLVVPHELFGAARRLLRDLIQAHDIAFSDTALDLGGHDGRDDV